MMFDIARGHLRFIHSFFNMRPLEAPMPFTTRLPFFLLYSAGHSKAKASVGFLLCLVASPW